MTKILCDICGEEIDSKDESCSMEISAVNNVLVDVSGHACKKMFYDDLCVNCAREIQESIIKFALSKDGGFGFVYGH